ncbi:MAG: hypothetical protein WCT51_00660 [Candidatus Shapirobacteria bacterium]
MSKIDNTFSKLVEDVEKKDPEITQMENLFVMKRLESAYPHAFLKFEKGDSNEYCLVLNCGKHNKKIIGKFGIVNLTIDEYGPVVSEYSFDITPIIRNLFEGKEPLERLIGVTIKQEYINVYIKNIEEKIKELSNGWGISNYDYPENWSEYYYLINRKNYILESIKKDEKIFVKCSAKKYDINRINIFCTRSFKEELDFAENHSPLKTCEILLDTLTKPSKKFRLFSRIT